MLPKFQPGDSVRVTLPGSDTDELAIVIAVREGGSSKGRFFEYLVLVSRLVWVYENAVTHA